MNSKPLQTLQIEQNEQFLIFTGLFSSNFVLSFDDWTTHFNQNTGMYVDTKGNM